MKRYTLLVLVALLASCKKDHADDDFADSRWTFRYKLNSTFTFFAQSELYLNEQREAFNYRLADTVAGNWTHDDQQLQLTFDNGEVYTTDYLSRDSLHGVSEVAGNTGEWYAVRQ
ncbi:MAG TPA: hypothetical protein PK534_11820 [Chitinophagales bacterium]|nr:hypothetical protein [Chitinophagales bacterium]